jgi:PAS domain S-box-containing protein
MPPAVTKVRLGGDEAVLAWLRPALVQAGYTLAGSEERSQAFWIHAGIVDSIGALPEGPGVLLSPREGPIELDLARSGLVDVVPQNTPREWILARIEAVRGRVVHLTELTAELRRFEEFIGHLSDGVAVVDDTGAVVMVNAAGAAILGWPDAVRGRRLLDLAVPLDDISARRLNDATSDTRLNDVDVRVRLHDGSRVVLAVSSGSLQRAYGRAIPRSAMSPNNAATATSWNISSPVPAMPS